MEGAVMTLKGSKLTIVVDLEQERGPSKSGKTINIATSRGAVNAPSPYEHVKVNINLYKYPNNG